MDDPLDQAGRDPEVVAAAKAMLLDAIRTAHTAILRGDMPTRLKAAQMFATPAVKEVLSPAKGSDEDGLSALVEQFHETRRAANQ